MHVIFLQSTLIKPYPAGFFLHMDPNMMRVMRLLRSAISFFCCIVVSRQLLLIYMFRYTDFFFEGIFIHVACVYSCIQVWHWFKCWAPGRFTFYIGLVHAVYETPIGHLLNSLIQEGNTIREGVKIHNH